MFGLGMQEMLIVGIVAVLLFGRKLPEVARSMGTSYKEFRKGLNDIQTQVDINDHNNYSHNNYQDNYHSSYDDDVDEATAPKFDPPPAEPKAETASDSASDSSETA